MTNYSGLFSFYEAFSVFLWVHEAYNESVTFFYLYCVRKEGLVAT